ncbi:MAG: TSUP family transporter, partial [Clostridiales bacterium]|nr:TSUP family transporter [Clostridiales bacterium]
MSAVGYVIIGLLSGIISGMGIGGGTILIPALCILYDTQQQTAQNINLIYFIPTAIIALITHVKQGNIEKKPLPPII